MRIAVLALVCCCVIPVGAASVDSIDLYEIRDPNLVIELWRAAEAEGLPVSANYQVLIQPSTHSTLKKVFLLREGTQTLELPEFTISLLSGGRARRVDPEESRILRAPETNLWQGLWKNQDSIYSWLQWPTGIVGGWQTSISGVGGRTQINRIIEFNWKHSPHRFAHFEWGLVRNQYGGDISRSLYPRIDSITSNFWSEGHWGWHASLGVPGLMWEIALSNQALPEFYWMDPLADSSALTHDVGKLVKQWDLGTRLKDNFSHALHAKIGSLRYHVYLDGDAYRYPIHALNFEELPAPFGPWGFGLMIAGPTVFTRGWVDILPVHMGVTVLEAWPSILRFLFVHFDFAYRDLKNYHISIATRVSWDSPILHWPGVRL